VPVEAVEVARTVLPPAPREVPEPPGPSRPAATAFPAAAPPVPHPRRGRQQVDEAGAAPAPVVHVTIERIDVRAVPPPAAPAARPAPAPRLMTLEEYLRQRGGR